ISGLCHAALAPATYASRIVLPLSLQGSLPAGWLSLYREGVEPSGSLQKVSDHPSSFSGLSLAQGKFHVEPPSRFTVAVGTCVSSRAPRTEPYVRLSRIRLPPWVCDGEAIARPRMKDDRFREPGLRPLRHPYPRDAILVAATPQRAPPEVDDMVPEHGQCMGVGRHGVIAEVATNDVPQPFPLIGEWLVHALPQLLFDHPQLRPHAISPGLPFDLEFAL